MTSDESTPVFYPHNLKEREKKKEREGRKEGRKEGVKEGGR